MPQYGPRYSAGRVGDISRAGLGEADRAAAARQLARFLVLVQPPTDPETGIPQRGATAQETWDTLGQLLNDWRDQLGGKAISEAMEKGLEKGAQLGKFAAKGVGKIADFLVTDEQLGDNEEDRLRRELAAQKAANFASFALQLHNQIVASQLAFRGQVEPNHKRIRIEDTDP